MSRGLLNEYCVFSNVGSPRFTSGGNSALNYFHDSLAMVLTIPVTPAAQFSRHMLPC